MVVSGVWSWRWLLVVLVFMVVVLVVLLVDDGCWWSLWFCGGCVQR